MPKKIFTLLFFLLIAISLSACVATQNTRNNQPIAQEQRTSTQPGAGIANPASVNCDQQGGQLLLMDKVINGQNLGQFGICYFEDNRQCEEWALLRGDCPVGGVKVTGYANAAAAYCAMTGNTYKITKAYPDAPADKEEGTCQLKSGQVCEVWAYYGGDCPAE